MSHAKYTDSYIYAYSMKYKCFQTFVRRQKNSRNRNWTKPPKKSSREHFFFFFLDFTESEQACAYKQGKDRRSRLKGTGNRLKRSRLKKQGTQGGTHSQDSGTMTPVQGRHPTNWATQVLGNAPSYSLSYCATSQLFPITTNVLMINQHTFLWGWKSLQNYSSQIGFKEMI